MRKKLFFLSILLCWLPTQVHSTVSKGWEKHIIADQSSPIYLYVKDMDGDNDLDIASTTNRHPLKWDSEVAWFRNNLDQDVPWDKFIISSGVPEDNPITNTNGIAISDIDKDGYEDVVVGTGMVTEKIGSVYWFKAPDKPTGKWQRYDIEVDTANSYFKIYTMDINKDTMEDIIVGGRQGAVLFINPGNPDQAGASWEKIAFPEGMGGSFYLDDLNGDGNTDLLNSNSKGNVSWIKTAYEEGKVIFNRTIIDDDLTMAFDINCMDINSDGKKDIIATILNQPNIYWYEAPLNDDDPWEQHVLSDTFSGTDMYTGDINGDLKTDLVVSGAFIDKLAWFEYRGKDSDILWTEHIIDDTINDPGDVSLDDLDGDGDLDVIVAGLREDQMIWYENKISEPNGEITGNTIQSNLGASMKPLVLIGTILVHLALISYGIGIVSEQRKHRVTQFILVFLALGLIFDLGATVCMVTGAGRGFLTKHSALGYSCLLAMAIDTVLVLRQYLKHGDQQVPYALHLYSRYAYLWWVMGAYITGGFLAFLSVSTALLDK